MPKSAANSRRRRDTLPARAACLMSAMLGLAGCAASSADTQTRQPATTQPVTTQPATTQPSNTIYHANEPIVIDGQLDDDAWRHAHVVEAKYEMQGTGDVAERPHMLVRFTWDEHYLYIGYEVFDEHLVGISDGREKGPKDNRRTASLAWAPERKVDVAEFFVSMNDPSVMWEVQHNAADHFNDILDIVVAPDAPINQTNLPMGRVIMAEEQYIRDAGKRTVKWARTLKPKADGRPSTVNDDTDTDTGYIGEIRLPWAGIGAPKDSLDPRTGAFNMQGRSITLFAALLDGTDGANYWHSSPTRPPGGMFATAFDHFPQYELTDEASAPPASGL